MFGLLDKFIEAQKLLNWNGHVTDGAQFDGQVIDAAQGDLIYSLFHSFISI